MSDDIIMEADRGLNTCLVLLDFSKAFDTLEHDLLCDKMYYFGLSREVVAFFKSYLGKRTQRVIFNGMTSDSLMVGRGVPQGSILGPLLYLLYTSDFGTFLKHCNMHLYADDSQIYLSFSLSDSIAAAQRMNEDLAIISGVSSAHSLKLNESKTEVLLFGKNSNFLQQNGAFQLNLNGTKLTFTDSCRNLGVQFDTDLRFLGHVNNLLQKCYFKLKLLYAHRDVLSTDIKLRLCDSLILSLISYCDVVYWPALRQQDRHSLQKLQNACVRFSYNLRKFDHISDCFRESHWLNLDERFQVHMACLVYKINRTQEPLYLSEKLILV